MQHDAETITKIRIQVNTWLNANPNDMIDLMEEFSSELKYDKDFGYKREQFRCWVYDTVLNKD
jgi:hypothetical protein